jgi:hypothetical protein
MKLFVIGASLEGATPKMGFSLARKAVAAFGSTRSSKRNIFRKSSA